MVYPTELVEKAKYEVHVFERVSRDTGNSLIAEVERLRATLRTVRAEMDAQDVLFELWGMVDSVLSPNTVVQADSRGLMREVAPGTES